MKKAIILILLAIGSYCQAQTVIKPEQTQSVTGGTTVTVTSGVGLLKVNPSSTMASLAVTFPSTPNDRDVLLIQFGGVLTTGTVVTLLSFVGTTLGSLPTTAVVGCICWIYDASQAKWYRLY